jgi:protein O-GlcNAc transferase
MEGFRHYQAGRLGETERICQDLLQRISALPDVVHLLGMTRAAQGRHEEALSLYDQALSQAAQPVSSMYSNKGLSLKALGRLREAEAAFRRAVTLDPNEPRVRKNLGLLLMDVGNHRQAKEEFCVAIELAPSMADIWGELSLCHIAMADWKVAEEAARRALEINSEVFNAHSALSTIHLQRFEFELAAIHFAAARKIDSTSVVLLENYSQTLFQTNQTEEARSIAAEIFSLTGRIEGRIRELLFMPVIYESPEHISDWRDRRRAGLEMLMAMPPQASGIEISHLYDTSVFYLAFHGQNDLNLMRALASFYEHLLPDLKRPTPHLNEIQNRSDSIRIGFFSKNVHDHPITHCFSELFEFISRQKDVSAFLISPMGFELSALQGTYANFVGEKIPCLGGYQGARQLLEDLKLDMIIYTDIGMDSLSYFLASTRLAAVQCSVPGHPVTTGISNVDYYISGAENEPADAQEQYSEKLILVNQNYAKFPRPPEPDILATPEELGLPSGGRYYMCPVMLQKMHPEFDQKLAEILRLDSDALIIVFEVAGMPWSNVIRARLSKIMSESEMSRIKFLPHIPDRRRFVSVLSKAHVVLDTLHFNLGSTFAFIVQAGAPFVTWAGRTNRGRVGYYMSRILEVPELVCLQQSEYSRLAVQIANNTRLREDVQRRYAANKRRLFESQEGIEEFWAKLQELVIVTRGNVSTV